jgi:prepilin-type N-terminal cleavage/methylation domain-containing protein
MARAQQGVSLIEMAVALALIAILAVMAAPFTVSWSYGASTLDAKGRLVFAYAKAKALAMRNPTSVLQGIAAAGMVVSNDGTTTTVLVCKGAGSAATCSASGANLVWSTTYSSKVATTLSGTLVATGTTAYVDLDNRGTALATATFTLSRGSGNDETGTLY